MKEHEFKCKKCGNTWYATDKDIRESRKQQSNIQRAKLQNASGFRGKKYTKRSAESHECRKHRATKTLIVAQAVAHEMLKLWEVQRGTKVVA